jgi:hypothetical protein
LDSEKDTFITSLEEKILCTAVFLDVAQVFDKVWHIGLIYKIKNAFPRPGGTW